MSEATDLTAGDWESIPGYLRRILDRLDELIELNQPSEPQPAVRLELIVGPVTVQGTGHQGDHMQIHDNEEYTFTVAAKDAKGFPTPDSVTAVSSDTTVAAVSADAAGAVFTVVAGNVGSAVITVSDGTLSVTEAVDVVAAGATTMVITDGPVTVQPTPPPPPPPPPAP